MNARNRVTTYVVVASFLSLIAVFVCLGFGFIWLTLLRVQGLPFLTEHLAHLAFSRDD